MFASASVGKAEPSTLDVPPYPQERQPAALVLKASVMKVINKKWARYVVRQIMSRT